jgi:hypothetical protein
LATTFVGGDATNIPACHPIRWPGSWHRKIDPARLCEIIALDPDREIELDTALKILETLAPPEQKKTKPMVAGRLAIGTRSSIRSYAVNHCTSRSPGSQ